jgi:hypothetical protein
MMRLAGYVERRLNRTTTLRHELRQHWVLPEEEQFHSTAPDWLLPLLSSVHAEAKAKTLLLLWRACQLRNDIEGPKTATRGGVNRNQSKFLTGIWPMSQIQPEAVLF